MPPRESQPTALLDWMASQKSTFEVRYYIAPDYRVTPYDYTEITDFITKCNYYYLPLADSVYGFNVVLNGYGWDSSLFKPGAVIYAERRVKLDGVWNYSKNEAWDRLFQVIVMPGSVSIGYKKNECTLKGVDIISFLGRTQAPIIVLGNASLAKEASVSADSVAVASNIDSAGEFSGEPLLLPENAIDGVMDTLWISQKAPTRAHIASDIPLPSHETAFILNEAYFNPRVAYSRQKGQWFEFVCKEKPNSLDSIFLQTKAGIIHVDGISFAQPDPPIQHNNAKFMVLCYDTEIYNSLWGRVADVPVFQWREHLKDENIFGSIDGIDWGFNLDGRGDYLAVMQDSASRSSYRWETMLIIDGPDTQRSDSGIILGITADGIRVSTTHSWAENELAGCFIHDVARNGDELSVRYIAGNYASVGGYTDIRWPTDENIERDVFRDYGDQIEIRGWPYRTQNAQGKNWRGNFVPDPAIGSSVRRKLDGAFNINQNNNYADDWEEDPTPAPGYSGKYSDEDGWAWLMVSPRPMIITLTQDLNPNDEIIHVDGTSGLLPAGTLYITGNIAEYSQVSSETITLAAPWSGPVVPANNTIRQYENGAATDIWPISRIIVHRRPVPVTIDGEERHRTISDMQVFGSIIANPRTPGDDNWKLDWLGNAPLFSIGNNSQLTTFTWDIIGSLFPEPYLRLRHVLFTIQGMIDGSNARINEIELLPPSNTVDRDTDDDISTVAKLFEYLLKKMGANPAYIHTSNASQFPIKTLNTDGSDYISMLSDLAVRTGHFVRALPHSFGVAVATNPSWPGGLEIENQANLTVINLQSAQLMNYDNLAISQIGVMARDGDMNVAIGRYPPQPRGFGNEMLLPTVIHADLEFKDLIARFFFYRLTQDHIIVTTTGPAPWMRPGHRVTLTWPLDNQRWYGEHCYVETVENIIDHGGKDQPRSWKASAELRTVRPIPEISSQ